MYHTCLNLSGLSRVSLHQHIQMSVEELLQGGSWALCDISGLKLSLPEAQLGQGRCSTTKSCTHRTIDFPPTTFLHPPQYKMATTPVTQNGNTVVLILAFFSSHLCQARILMVLLLLFIEELTLCLCQPGTGAQITPPSPF